jgi:thiol-disulfide isomerase/thioredoxin
VTRAIRLAALGAALAAVLVLGGCGPGAGSSAPRRSPGHDPFLALVMEDPHGRALHFSDFKGQVRIIDVWASWCGPCRMTIPELNALYGRYHGRGLVIIGVSVDDEPAAVLEFQRRVPVRYPTVMFNPPLALLIGQPSSIPTTFVVDRGGEVVKTFVGYVDAATLEAEILKLL